MDELGEFRFIAKVSKEWARTQCELLKSPSRAKCYSQMSLLTQYTEEISRIQNSVDKCYYQYTSRTNPSKAELVAYQNCMKSTTNDFSRTINRFYPKFVRHENDK